jgi:hypothetical protein
MSKLASDTGSEYSCVKTSKNNHTVFLVIADKGADKFFIAKSFMESLAEGDDE